MKTVAVLRVFDIRIEDGTQRILDAHAVAGATELEPGNYELVLRPTTRAPEHTHNCAHYADSRGYCTVCGRSTRA
jgi:hypothetical protein